MARGKNQDRDLLQKSILLNIILAIALAFLAITMYLSPRPASANNSITTTIATNQSSGTGTLANINTPLNTTELSYINNEPLSNYETAGEMLLNSSLTNQVVTSGNPQYNAILVNGRPTVIYVGAISCIFCGENRWTMALALAKFGNFTQLFKGYSALQDGDVATLYWAPVNYTATMGVKYGNYYSSSLINFISAEYTSPITGGFQIQPISYFISKAPNATYTSALQFMNQTGKFQGTPFTFWGKSLVGGADAVIFGNSTPSSASSLPLAKWTHAQVLRMFKTFNSQFAYSEYAGADVYAAAVCPTVNESAPICAIPSIAKIQKAMGISR